VEQIIISSQMLINILDYLQETEEVKSLKIRCQNTTEGEDAINLIKQVFELVQTQLREDKKNIILCNQFKAD